MKDFRSWQDAPQCQDDGGPIRIYQPSGGDGELSAASRLSDFYRTYYRPVIETGRANHADTREQNQTAINLWVKITGDPPLSAIDQFTCAAFVDGLLRQPKIKSRTTVNKHCAAVQKVLNLAGPPSGKLWRAQGLIAQVPFIERPGKEHVRCDEPFRPDELELLVLNTHLMTRPNHLRVSVEIFWKALFVLLYNTGMRIQETILLEWTDIEGDEIRIRSAIRKGGRRQHRVQLTPTAMTALEWMRDCDRVRIFPWPACWGSKSNLMTEFREYRRQLLPPHRAAIAFHGFRRLHNVELSRINAKACEKSLGHAAAVNAEHYLSREIVRESVAQLRQPRLTQDRQQMLF